MTLKGNNRKLKDSSVNKNKMERINALMAHLNPLAIKGGVLKGSISKIVVNAS
jgi:hypothetical protein